MDLSRDLPHRDTPPPPTHLTQLLQELLRRLPTDTPICNGHSVLELLHSAILWLSLLSFVQVRLDHDPRDSGLALCDLVRDFLDHLWLIPVVLVGVAVGGVDHDARVSVWQCLLELCARGLDGFGIVVGALGTSAVDNVKVRVAGRLDDGGETLGSDTHEGMWLRGGTDSIDCDAETSICAVLEANGHRETRHCGAENQEQMSAISELLLLLGSFRLSAARVLRKLT